MSKWVVDIHGDIEGDYEIIKKYEEPKTDLLEQIRAEIEQITDTMGVRYNQYVSKIDVLQIIDKYKENNDDSN